MRTQYGKASAQASPSRYKPPDWFASHCYLVVVQDVRGQGASGGTFSEFTHDMQDGYDSVEWAAALPGADGKVGMYGSSYVGATQWLAAVVAPPHLVTIVPANSVACWPSRFTLKTSVITGLLSRTVRKMIGAAMPMKSTPPNHVDRVSQ